MSKTILGIDLAKNVFQLCLLRGNSVVYNKKVSRRKLLDSVRQLEPKVDIAMEACSTAHYWGRQFKEMGHNVLLVPPQHVKAFVKNNKNDANDALAICEAACRPNIHFVPVKNTEQQDLCILHNIRQSTVEQRVALSNQIRGLASEYGVTFGQRKYAFRQQLPQALEDASNGLTIIARQTLNKLYEQWLDALEREVEIEQSIVAISAKSPAYELLKSVPGIGPILASAFIANIGNGRQFKNGRQLSAWIGLVPRQASSGGKTQLGGITKNGNRYLRSILIHGARSALQRRGLREDRLGEWMKSLVSRRGFNKACVAYANKCARMCWSILAKNESFNVQKAFI